MTKLIVNADDFGYSEGLNYGVVSAHKKGIVTSCTVMANMPGFEHGMELLKNTPTLRAGVHLTLTCYKPLLQTHKTLVNEKGYFYKSLTPELGATFDLEEVYEEFCAQIDRVKEHIEISHLDSHHHVHGLEELKPVMERIFNKYKFPMRKPYESQIEGAKYVPVYHEFYGKNVEKDFFEKHIEDIKKYEVLDFMSHPAFLDDFILSNTSYAIERTKEYGILSDGNLKKYLADNGIKLINYSDL